jgi:UrcA family protein
MKAMKKTLAATTLAGSLLAVALPGQAENVTAVTANALTDRNAVVVNYEDLDLTSPKAMETLYQRISRAAKEVCGPTRRREAGSLMQANRNAKCYGEAVSKAMAAVTPESVASRS